MAASDVTDISIRPARAADSSSIAKIYNQYIDGGNYTMDTVHWTTADVRARIDLLRDREQLLVLCAGRDVAGWGIVQRYSERFGYRVSCETSLYLDVRYTGRGLGACLVKALFDCCRQFGYHHAVARIRAVNEASIRFHEQHGFERVGRQREVGFVHGRWEDVVIMQRIFSDVLPPVSSTGATEHWPSGS